MGSETELKLRLTPSLMAAVQQQFQRLGKGTTVVLDNTYYDTADRLLLRHGMALRVRRAGRQAVQTLKTGDAAGALSRRGEWEVPAPRGRPDPQRFADTPLAALLHEHPRARLRPLFTTRFTRRTWTIETPDAQLEAALDSGWIEPLRAPQASTRTASRASNRAPQVAQRGATRGEPRERVLELELELKRGAEAGLPSFALQLQKTIDGTEGLVPYSDSKATRGYRLATGRARKPFKANAAAFAAALPGTMHAPPGDADIAALVRAYAARGTELLLANTSGDPPLEDPEFVHQARVAMRRLRSVLRLLRDEVDVPERCADAMRWIARELGRVRDLDVLAQATLPALKAALEEARALDRATLLSLQAAQAKLERQRARAIARLRALLRSRRYATAVLRLLQWSAAGSASAPPAGSSKRGRRSSAAMPSPRSKLRDVAVPLLKAMHRRLVRDAQRFASLSPDRQHRVRIRIKRLRYALDLCAPVLPDAERILPLIEDLQDTLGELNDIAVLEEALPRLTSSERLLALAHVRRRALAGTLADRAQGQLATLVHAPWPWAVEARKQELRAA